MPSHSHIICHASAYTYFHMPLCGGMKIQEPLIEYEMASFGHPTHVRCRMKNFQVVDGKSVPSPRKKHNLALSLVGLRGDLNIWKTGMLVYSDRCLVREFVIGV